MTVDASRLTTALGHRYRIERELGHRSYAVTPDGRGFLFARYPGGEPSLAPRLVQVRNALAGLRPQLARK